MNPQYICFEKKVLLEKLSAPVSAHFYTQAAPGPFSDCLLRKLYYTLDARTLDII